MYLPLVSIIIPCYNNKNVIFEAIDSALNQSYPRVEVIVVDDGSTDGSYEFVFDRILEGQNLRIVRQDNQGPAAARNTGFTLSGGDYLVFLDADDILHPDYVESCYREYEKDPSLNIVYCEAELFENKTGLWKLKPFSESTILLYNSIPVFAMLRSQVFQQIGKYDTQLKCSEDWELWIRLLQQFEGVYKIPKVLFYYRKRNEQNSITDQDKIYNFRHDSLLYIYTKHQQLYRNSDLDMTNLLSAVVYKERYYNEWYRKLYYRLFRRQKYAEIYRRNQPVETTKASDWLALARELSSLRKVAVKV
ncbi:glycosyltransferase [Dyadobacter sp. 32]|uniref:glycosyltransferase n=1 Tax=Dyadobacter sp. 32 TaxID=538966 RepID=UPI0011EFCB03